MKGQSIANWYIIPSAMLTIIVAILSFAAASDPVPRLCVPCTVLSIHDGDTLTVEVTTRVNVRLLDCWAPEITGKDKPAGLIAKKRLEELALGKAGLLTIPLHDNVATSFSFGRVLGRISVDGHDVSEQMVAAGAATKTKTK